MYTPNCDVFWPGSYPSRDPASACRRIMGNPLMLLHWPQLPKKAKKESLIAQTYAALTTPNDGFARGSASGWNTLMRMLKRRKKARGAHFKTQLAGPITLLGKLNQGGVKNEERLLKAVNIWLGHAYWQISEIRAAGYRPLIVLDEPLLPNLMGPEGSAKLKRTLRLLKSIVKRLRARGALVGIHCCNRVSIGSLLDLGFDLVHVDAYHFPTQIARARPSLQRFMAEGGIVAWGVVPTSETLTPANKLKIEKKLTDLLSTLESRALPLRRILAQSMVAPTCGTGLLSSEQSDTIVEFTTSLASLLKSRYHL